MDRASSGALRVTAAVNDAGNVWLVSFHPFVFIDR